MKRACSLILVIAIAAFMAAGCGSGVSEDKPIADVKKEAQQMNAGQLEGIIAKYKKAIEAKKAELQKLQKQLKAIPAAQMMGEKAVAIRKDMENAARSIKALTERIRAYTVALNTKK
ncbi:MAG: hypothetical protein ABH862_03535 [Candidatus Omnitrophota bacterium]